jgi:TetR/AcrR family transcriptional repressor of mexJK operon
MARKSKKEEILAAAEALFTAKGFSGVSMDDIAARTPVSKPTLYSNFRDKGALFSAVIERKCASFLDVMKMQMDAQEKPEVALKRVGETYLGKILAPGALSMVRVIISAGDDFPGIAEKFYASGPRQMQTLLAEYLSAQHTRKRMRIEDPEAAAEMFMGLLKGNLHFRRLLGIGGMRRGEAVRTVDYAVKIFLSAHARS